VAIDASKINLKLLFLWATGVQPNLNNI